MLNCAMKPLHYSFQIFVPVLSLLSKSGGYYGIYENRNDGRRSEWILYAARANYRCLTIFNLPFPNSETKSLFDRSSLVDRKETLPPLPEIDSPPMSPRKQLRPIKTKDSYDSQDGRSVEELKSVIKKVLQNNFQAFEEVRDT